MRNLILKGLDIYHYVFSFDKGLFSFFAPGGACKYYPSCSLYTKQMIAKYGIIVGLKLGFFRVIKCR